MFERKKQLYIVLSISIYIYYLYHKLRFTYDTILKCKHSFNQALLRHITALLYKHGQFCNAMVFHCILNKHS
jgi:hypothetical protein